MTGEDNSNGNITATGPEGTLAVSSTQTFCNASEVIIKSECTLRVPWLFR